MDQSLRQLQILEILFVSHNYPSLILPYITEPSCDTQGKRFHSPVN